MPESKTPPTSLSLIVLEGDSDAQAEIREAGIKEALKGLFVGKKDVPLEKVEAELERVQTELDELLSKINKDERHGFRLSEVEFSLSISAEGSIGVVTAGAEVGISLTFSKS